MRKDFYEAVKERRSIYQISDEAVVSEARIKEIVEEALKYTPSAFNSQSARMIVLLGEQHDKLWDITKQALKKIVPADSFPATEEKIDGFGDGYGTILFFEDNSIIESMQSKFELYRDNFPVWSQQSSGMLQFVVWTALGIEGIGASLQHYNELIETEVKREWQLPDKWQLVAQMPFGKPENEPGEKEFKPVDSRMKVIN